MAKRETGTVTKWDEHQGYGFIERDELRNIIFVHVNDVADRQALVPGSRVSFVYELRETGGKALEVIVEELAAIRERERGVVVKWKYEKGFGFIKRLNGEGEGDIYFPRKSFAKNVEPYSGQAVSFVPELGSQGLIAVNVREDDGDGGGGVTDAGGEERRAIGKFKNRDKTNVSDTESSDDGRDFGDIKIFIIAKGFGYIVPRKDGEDVKFLEEDLNGVRTDRNTCVSFVRELGIQGPLAKDLREEDPDRVARVTAQVHYGKVVDYNYPPLSDPDAGYGFIVELDQPSYKKPTRHYFHASEIVNPNEDGNIDLDARVSFIFLPATKGFQAADVTIVDPSNKERAPTKKKTRINASKETTANAIKSEWGWESP